MLYLIGFMGVGKTTIGKKLSKKYNINFIDTDEEIERVSHKSISTIFQRHGEDHFRRLETITLKSIKKNNIVACGGGLPFYNNNMYFIKKSGLSIYLKASKEEIFVRLEKDYKTRPLLQNKSIKALKEFINEKLIEREKFYNKANHTIDTTNLSIEEVLRKIDTLAMPF